MLTLADIERARARIGNGVHLSPCPVTRTLSERTGCTLHLKLENLQMTGSFKERGACNKLLALTDSERAQGIVAASAGNHAQGVAYHASRLAIDATLVMPRTTALVKVSATRTLGGRVILHGSNYDEAFARAVEIAHEEGRVLVHPFDDPEVMAGQGTLALELLEQIPDIEAVVVPVGGGGLIGGMAIALKALRPSIAVYGVEPCTMPSMGAALEAGGPVEVAAAQSIAEGIAVRKVGGHPYEVAARHVDAMVSVDEEEIAQAILALLEEEKTVAEGAGAAALAALLHGHVPVRGKRVVAVVSGGNIDVHLVSRVIERGLAKSGRLMRFRVTIPDVPGALARLLAVLGDRGANVLQVSHDRLAARVELGQAAVDLTLETRGFEHVEEIEEVIRAAGFTLH